MTLKELYEALDDKYRLPIRSVKTIKYEDDDRERSVIGGQIHRWKPEGSGSYECGGVLEGGKHFKFTKDEDLKGWIVTIHGKDYPLDGPAPKKEEK